MSSVPVTAETAPLRYHSTRDPQARVSFSQALLQGLAPDGGLYVPTSWPRVDPQGLGAETDLPALGARFLAAFVAGDLVAGQLPEITRDAFNFPAPLVPLD